MAHRAAETASELPKLTRNQVSPTGNPAGPATPTRHLEAGQASTLALVGQPFFAFHFVISATADFWPPFFHESR